MERPIARDPHHVLFVVRDAGVGGTTRDYLANYGIRVSVAIDVESARLQLATRRVDLVLLDLSLRGQSGLVLARELGHARTPPFLVLVGRTDATERIVSLEIGADDCLTMPVQLRELLARIRAVWRRATRNGSCLSGYRRIATFGEQQFDMTAQRLVDNKGHIIRLTTGETLLLRTFLENARVVLSRAQLSSSITPDNIRKHERAVDVLVSRLRTKLGGPEIYIRCVRGKGYMFVCHVEWQLRIDDAL